MEKHQRKPGKYLKKLEKQSVKHEKTFGEMKETRRELPLRGFLSHLVFKPLHTLRDSLANDCRICHMGKSIQSSPFFSWFSPTHDILCKIYLNDG